MGRRAATLAVAAMFALALSASPASAGSHADRHGDDPVVTHKPPSDITGASMQCGRNTYTVLSGTSDEVDRLWPPTASGDVRGTETWTLRNVRVVDQHGRRHSVFGWQQFDGTWNPDTGGTPADGPFSRFRVVQMLKIQGTRDGSSLVGRQLPDGTLPVDVSGTCAKDPWYLMLW